MFGLIFKILLMVTKIVTRLPYIKNHPKLLKLDKWLEKKIGIDIIKQEKKWFEKHPLLEERIKSLEEDLDDLYKKVNSKK